MGKKKLASSIKYTYILKVLS